MHLGNNKQLQFFNITMKVQPTVTVHTHQLQLSHQFILLAVIKL